MRLMGVGGKPMAPQAPPSQLSVPVCQGRTPCVPSAGGGGGPSVYRSAREEPPTQKSISLDT